ncbi:hypothetical protein HYH02_005568 [Chlamydomonas schloesseri]|uniref:SRCR domain-containing protein n=1 Tax=Chlamydomonas schloesseri TaxID=2026947 RepID=A0A836B6W0_9CHLO|nr:hypothetical protein HYH02_005568 [Chlamydomonas schloesseri]|eukprot:KAG2449421.1 hypothetical protein HYH02_005568 [Chlamydomonas schloesseri]
MPRASLLHPLLLLVMALSSAVVHAAPNATVANNKSPAANPSPKPSPTPCPKPSPKRPSPKPRPSPRKSPKPMKSPPPPAFMRAKNGIRLVDGSGPKGRLEVSSTDGWLTDYVDGAVAWRPLCATGFFDDSMAQVMCEMLDYKYGRLYYTAKVAYPTSYNKSEYASQDPLDFLTCHSNSPPTDDQFGGRRMLRDSAASSEVAAAAEALGGDHQHRELRGQQQQQQHSHGRSLTAPLRGTVATPPESPYACNFRLGDCTYDGPLVGIECSKTEFPPAPPPPPSPPNTPSAPPPRSEKLRLIGGSYRTGNVEPNLCNDAVDGYPECNQYGRVEVQVSDVSGNLVWAPLCSALDGDEPFVADVVCKQAFDWPDKPKPSFYVNGNPLIPGWTIPTSQVTDRKDFNPAKYTGWATIVGGDVTTALSLQELDIQVTTTPCDSGHMFGVSCQIAM